MITFILDNEQATTCPKCGSRTDFHQTNNEELLQQFHSCLNSECKFEFVGEFED